MLITQSIGPTVAVKLNSEEIFSLDEISSLENDKRIAKVALINIANFINSYPEFNNSRLKEKLRLFIDNEIQIDMLHLAIEIINVHPRIITVKNEANKAYKDDDKRVFITYQNSVNSNTLNEIAIDHKGIILKDLGNFVEHLRVLQVPLATINILERLKFQLANQASRQVISPEIIDILEHFKSQLAGEDLSELAPLETFDIVSEGPTPPLGVSNIYQPLLQSSQRNRARRRCSLNCNRLSDTTRTCLTFFIAMAAFASIILLFSNKEEQN